MNGFQIKCKHNHFLQFNSGEEKYKITLHKISLTVFIIYGDFPFFSLILYFLEKWKNTEQINNVLPIYKDLLYFQKWGKLAHDFHFKSDVLTVMVKNKNSDKLHLWASDTVRFETEKRICGDVWKNHWAQPGSLKHLTKTKRDLRDLIMTLKVTKGCKA